MSRIPPEYLGPETLDRSVAADVLVREEQEEEDEEENEQDKDGRTMTAATQSEHTRLCTSSRVLGLRSDK